MLAFIGHHHTVLLKPISTSSGQVLCRCSRLHLEAAGTDLSFAGGKFQVPLHSGIAQRTTWQAKEVGTGS